MRYFLLLMFALLIGLIFYEIQYYPGMDAELKHVDQSSEVLEENNHGFDSQLHSIQAYSEIIDRPLFSFNRKPPNIADQNVSESISVAELEDLVLFGVITSQDITYALIKDNNTGETEQIRKGRQYRGWKVSEIDSESIKFEADDAQYELFLSPNENNKKSGIKNNKKAADRTSLSRVRGNKKPTEKTVIKSYKSIFRSSQKSSPIKLPPESSTQKKKPELPELSEGELEKIYEDGGYEYNPNEDEFDDDEEDYEE